MKYFTRLWREYLQEKYQKKMTYKVLEGILTAKIANIKKKINSTTADLYFS